MGMMKGMLMDTLAATPTTMLVQELAERIQADGVPVNELCTAEVAQELVARLKHSNGIEFMPAALRRKLAKMLLAPINK